MREQELNRGPRGHRGPSGPGIGVKWDDLRFAFHGRNLDKTSGHLDYDVAELGVNFDDSSRYNDADQIGIIAQMPHNYKFGTNLKPHAHWIQNQDEVPNALLKYRIYDNGEVPGSWILAAPTGIAFEYEQNALQIIIFPEIDMSTVTGVSSFIDIKMYRDASNASGLFSGSDDYSGNVLMKEFDFHYQIDSLGSRQEYIK